MLEDLTSSVRRLNRLSRLYDEILEKGTPYRVSRIKKLYHEVVIEIKRRHTITMMDSHVYFDLFGADNELGSILEKKERAARDGQYEMAAEFRYAEKRVLSLKLSKLGFDINENFIIISDKIYQVPK